MATSKELVFGKLPPRSSNEGDVVAPDGWYRLGSRSARGWHVGERSTNADKGMVRPVSGWRQNGAEGMGEFWYAITPVGYRVMSDALTVGDQEPEEVATYTGSSGERRWT